MANVAKDIGEKIGDVLGSGSPREEGRLTQAVEQQTAKIPSISFLGLAGASVLLSLFYKIRGQNTVANFIGLWVPSILLLGIYNKLVKLEGSNRSDI